MRTTDVKIGGEYAAKVSGKRTVVKVTAVEVYDYVKPRRTRIIAVNTATGREVSFRSARKLSPV